MLTVFIGIASGSFLCLLILLILNIDHEFEIGHGVDIGHEIDVGHEIGHEVGHEVGVLGDAGPGMLSIRLFLFFLLGFGAFGMIATVLKLSPPWAILIAFIGAFISYFVAYKLLKLFWKQQISTQFSLSSLIGTQAIVTRNIPTGGVGEIKSKSPTTGLENYVVAKAAIPEQSIKKNEIVIIKNIVASICIVEKEN